MSRTSPPRRRRGSGVVRVAREFVRNLAVTISLPFIELLRTIGSVEVPRPDSPRLKALTENPAGRTALALGMRVTRRLAGRPLGAPDPIVQRLQALATGGRTIVVGPWLSEVGFELLYWIPFVQWFVREHGVDPARIVVISRGGVAGWYAHVGGRYADILDHFTPDEFRTVNQQRIDASGHQKHMELGVTDQLVLDRVCGALQLRDYDVLHPSLMYQLLLPLWQRRAPAALACNHAVYLGLRAQDMAPLPDGLPPAYTAAKFYFSDAFPRTPDNVAKVRAMLMAQLERGPVVLLTSGVQLDDHSDMLDGLPPGLILYTPASPAQNLALQSAVVAHARLFIGTYGGFSYLAPLLGVPSLCVFSDLGRLMPMHMDVAFRVFRQFACGRTEGGCPAGSVGPSPTARFTALHIDALGDLAQPHVSTPATPVTQATS